jgi:hypothetical protein
MPSFRPGDILRAETIGDLYRRTEPPAVRVSGGGLSARASGAVLDVVAAAPLRFVGVAAAAIPARSGSTWGTGTVTRYAFDGTNDYSTGQDFPVVNPSSSKMTSGNGIDAGQYCWVEEDSDGDLVVAPLECS